MSACRLGTGRSARAVRLQPSNERVSVRLKELGEAWESAPGAGRRQRGGANGDGKHKHHRQQGAQGEEARTQRRGQGDANGGARSVLLPRMLGLRALPRMILRALSFHLECFKVGPAHH